MSWNLVKRFAGLGNKFYEFVEPTPLNNDVKLLHTNHDLLRRLNLDDLSENELLKICSGQLYINNYQSLATYYMGHQFGVPVAKLGDGRAILIAEQQSNNKIYELQLKGAGKTPFSRMGDGRAVLRSSIREYLVSHAMYQLGVSTTEAIAIVASQDKVVRETRESAAIVLRTAESFIRFGHFEYFAYHGMIDELEQLTRFVVDNYYPRDNLQSIGEAAQHLIQNVVINTASTIAKWQSLGFVHGVMNTDNMSMLGLTIDYGPYAFMDNFAPKHIYNHSDSDGRYTYANQPYIAWWNLYRLAEALMKLDGVTEDLLQPVLDSYAKYYNENYQQLMWQKLGIEDYTNVQDVEFIDDILNFLESNNIDYTIFWRKLSFGESGMSELKVLYSNVNFIDIFDRIENLQKLSNLTTEQIMLVRKSVNPAFILRNHLLHNAINKANGGNYTEMVILFDLATNPFEEVVGYEYYYQLPPVWANHLELGCSS